MRRVILARIVLLQIGAAKRFQAVLERAESHMRVNWFDALIKERASKILKPRLRFPRGRRVWIESELKTIKQLGEFP
jgi:hypothetical protein